MSSVYRSAPPVDMLLLVALYAAELFLLIMALAIYRLGDRALVSSLGSTPGIGFVVALLAFLAAAAIIARRYQRARRRGARSFVFTAAMNLITVALIFIPVEVAVRLLSRSASDTAIFLLRDIPLAPRNWEKAAAINREILDQASGDLSYLVYDETLGWTVGANRSGANGLYLSSAEGLRAARRGDVLAGPKIRPRIAIVGDSFVFAERVAFEDSWGHLLEASSGGKFEVLNFGVGGYSIDQAYLRVKKDVLAWQPDVIILGFPLGDLYRTLTVYPFISSPHWGIPFSKPRIVVDAHALRILNVPTIDPRVMFAQPSIEDLPFLEYDAGYVPRRWRQSRFADLSYVKRLLLDTWADKGSEPGSHGSDEELLRVNGAVFREFIRLAGANGAIPLIAYFPARQEILRSDGEQTEGQRIMEKIGVPFVDTTPCILEVGPDAGYVPNDTHYSPAGNEAVAKCLGAALSRILAEDKAGQLGSTQR